MRQAWQIIKIVFISAVCFLFWVAFGPFLQELGWLTPYVPEQGNLESLFAPAAALFSGLAAGFTVYAIIKQGNQFHRQQFENNFFSLLSIHRDNRKSLSFPWLRKVSDTASTTQGPSEFYLSTKGSQARSSKKKTCAEKAPLKTGEGSDAFHALYILLKTIWERARDGKRSEYRLDQISLDILEEQISQYRDGTGAVSLSKHRLFVRCYDVFRESTNYLLYDYFRHLYHLIKYTHNNAPAGKCSDYMGIIRAQFAPYEYLILYYHVLLFLYIEKDHNSSPFQGFIEDNCLLHNIQKDLRFDDGAAGEYKSSAFVHEKWEDMTLKEKWQLFKGWFSKKREAWKQRSPDRIGAAYRDQYGL